MASADTVFNSANSSDPISSVLLVGSMTVRSSLHGRLAQGLYRVFVAENAMDAKGVLRRETIDVILTDGAAGLELLTALNICPAAPIVIANLRAIREFSMVPRSSSGTNGLSLVPDSWPDDAVIAMVENAAQTARLKRENARISQALRVSRDLMPNLTYTNTRPSENPQAEKLALHDPLTGLANRMLALERLE